MRRLTTILAFIVALLLITGSRSALAQGATQSKLIVSAQAGYGDTGAYLMGEWVPVRVTLANPPGGASRRVTVRVATGSTGQGTLGAYQQEVDLPAQSRKEVTLYTYSSEFAHRFHVELYEGGTLIDSADATADPSEPPAGMIVAVASSDTSLLNALKGEQLGHVLTPLQSGGPGGYAYYGRLPATSTTVAHIALSDLPTLSQALDSLGAIVLDDVDSGALTDEQRSGLEGWVARGGLLLATYRPGGADTLAGLDDLMPVAVTGSRTVSSLSSLSDLVAAPLTTTGAITIGNASVKTGETFASSTRALAQQDGVPVFAVRDVGQGHVVYMGVSPSLPPLKGWDGLPALEKRIFSEHDLKLSYGGMLRFTPSSQSYGYYASGVYTAFGGMFDLPGLELPNVWLVGGFLLAYILIVGPLNFIILRRIRRTELAWFTIPGLVVLFSVIAYLLAVGSKGGDLVTIRVNAINTTEGLPVATLEQHVGVFSPLRSTYRFTLDANSAVTEMNPYGYYQARTSSGAPVSSGAGTTTIDNVNIDTWGLRAFVAEHTAALNAPLQADLHLGNNTIVGKVKNRTNGPLQDVALVRGDAVQYIGYIAPGDEADVRLPIQNGVFNNSSPEQLLPMPAGVVNPQNGYMYGQVGQVNGTAQREYDRKVNALSVALYPLLSAEPPTEMQVVMVAWGPAPPNRFEINGHSTQDKEENVWVSTAPVTATEGDQLSLDSNLVPFTVYAPGNSPSVLVPRGINGYQAGVPGSVQPGIPPPMPTTTAGATNSTLTVGPYADFLYRLPAGVQPQSLFLNYSANSASQSQGAHDLDVRAYNVQTGAWDLLGTLGVANGTMQQAISNPALYVGPAGDMTVRLSSPDGTTVNITGVFQLALNSTK